MPVRVAQPAPDDLPKAMPAADAGSAARKTAQSAA
jgi:hypothetical protein